MATLHLASSLSSSGILNKLDMAHHNDLHHHHDLPIHDLVHQGYDSIGCTHCTTKGTGRTGRWINNSKTECGLHVE